MNDNNVFTLVNFLPYDLANKIWKDVYSSNVVEKIHSSTCTICGRYSKDLYNGRACLLCLVTRYPCMCCLAPALDKEQVVEMEPSFDGKFLIQKKGMPYKWFTKQDLYEMQLLTSYYRCFTCLTSRMSSF